jgi:uncharacterized membrane protein
VGAGTGALIGLVLPVDVAVPELLMRTRVSPSDVALALAAGGAGILSMTAAMSTALVGVMAALALFPPLVAAGLCLGARYPGLAGGAALLFLVNLCCLNLAGVGALVLQGIRPNKWYELETAEKAVRRALVFWAVLVALLALGVWLLSSDWF